MLRWQGMNSPTFVQSTINYGESMANSLFKVPSSRNEAIGSIGLRGEWQ